GGRDACGAWSSCLRQLTFRSCVLNLPPDWIHAILGQVRDQVVKARQHHDLVALRQQSLSNDETEPEFVSTNKDSHFHAPNVALFCHIALWPSQTSGCCRHVAV